MAISAVSAQIMHSRVEAISQTRRTTLTLIERLSQQQADYCPGRNKWSVGEVADHLVLSSKLYRDGIARMIELARSGRDPVLRLTMQELNSAPFFLPQPLLPFMEIPLTVMSMFIPPAARQFLIRYSVVPANAPDLAVPRKGRDLHSLRCDLEAATACTRALLVANEGLDYGKMVLHHPILGTNTALDLLRLESLHEQRHQGQIESIMQSPGFPRRA